MINVLQAGRFVAAMAVVFHHAVISVTAFVSAPPPFLQAVLNYGYLGVDFFFVLSGFIIHYTMHRFPRSLGRFAYDRLTRIMLPYWPVGIVLAVSYTVLPSLSDSSRGWSWLSTITLIPTELPPALSVAWTLQHELLFYLIYIALFLSGRLSVCLGVWILSIIGGQLVVNPAVPFFQILLAPINVEFVAGIAAASIYMSGRPVSCTPSIAISAALLLVFAATGAERENSWLVGFAVAAFLPLLCTAESRGKFTVPGWLAWGGAASYAIYLVHNPILSVTSRVMGGMGVEWPEALLVSVMICIIIGGIYHAMWERPIMRLMRHLRRPYAVVSV